MNRHGKAPALTLRPNSVFRNCRCRAMLLLHLAANRGRFRVREIRGKFVTRCLPELAPDYHQGTAHLPAETKNFPGPAAYDGFQLGNATIAAAQPNGFRRRAIKKTHLMKVSVFGDDRKAVGPGKIPDQSIRGRVQRSRLDMGRSWKEISQRGDEAMRKVLIEQQAQIQAAPSRRRSRSAAKARQARTSSCDNSEKSRIISASLMPDAR